MITVITNITTVCIITILSISIIPMKLRDFFFRSEAWLK